MVAPEGIAAPECRERARIRHHHPCASDRSTRADPCTLDPEQPIHMEYQRDHAPAGRGDLYGHHQQVDPMIDQATVETDQEIVQGSARDRPRSRRV